MDNISLLNTLRQTHPDIPIVCITPIFSTLEFYNEEFSMLSHHTRNIVRVSVAELLAQGDNFIFIVEGDDLLSSKDTDGLTYDGMHPNGLGHSLIAERLQPTIEMALKISENIEEPSAEVNMNKLRP